MKRFYGHGFGLLGRFGPLVLLAPEDGAGQGGDGGDAAAGADAGGDGSAAAAPAAGDAAAQYRPEGLPDHLFGKDASETLAKVFGAFKGFQEEASKRGATPKDPDGYKLEVADTVKPFFGDEKDPAMGLARQAAHKHGLTDKQFSGFVNDFIGGLAEGKLISSPEALKEAEKATQTAELEAVRVGLGVGKDKDGGAAVSKHFEDNEAFVNGLAAQWKLPAEQAGALAALNDVAAGSLFLSKLRGELAERGLQIEGRPAHTGALSKDELANMMNDPRLDPGSSKYDQAFHRKWDEDWKRAYG